jgi:hypothetical protein
MSSFISDQGPISSIFGDPIGLLIYRIRLLFAIYYALKKPDSASLFTDLYSGMFPCFFGGFLSRLVSSMASA